MEKAIIQFLTAFVDVVVLALAAGVLGLTPSIDFRWGPRQGGFRVQVKANPAPALGPAAAIPLLLLVFVFSGVFIAAVGWGRA